MHGMYVHVSGGGTSEAFLQSWGRSANGWYGLIIWQAAVRLHGTPERATFSAWVPAARLSRPHYVSARRLPRCELQANRLDWPAPPRTLDVGYVIGAWDEGEPNLPAGMEWDKRPAWQRKRDTT